MGPILTKLNTSMKINIEIDVKIAYGNRTRILTTFSGISKYKEYIVAWMPTEDGKDCLVGLINLDSGVPWSNSVRVKSVHNISKEEMRTICGGLTKGVQLFYNNSWIDLDLS
jgi:hypothetical protein